MRGPCVKYGPGRSHNVLLQSMLTHTASVMLAIIDVHWNRAVSQTRVLRRA